MSNIPVFNIERLSKNIVKNKIRLAQLKAISRSKQLYLLSPFEQIRIQGKKYTEVSVGLLLPEGKRIESIDHVRITVKDTNLIVMSEIQNMFLIDKPLRHQMGLFGTQDFTADNIKRISIPIDFYIDWDLYYTEGYYNWRQDLDKQDYKWKLIARKENIELELIGQVSQTP